MQSDTAKAVLQRSNSSRKEQPDGIRPWLVTDHPEWLQQGDTKDKEPAKVVDIENDAPASDQKIDAPKDKGKMVEEFMTAHPDVRVDYEGETKAITVSIPMKPIFPPPSD